MLVLGFVPLACALDQQTAAVGRRTPANMVRVKVRVRVRVRVSVRVRDSVRVKVRVSVRAAVGRCTPANRVRVSVRVSVRVGLGPVSELGLALGQQSVAVHLQIG